MVTTYINKIDKIKELMIKADYQEAEEKLQELKNIIVYDIAIKNCKGTKKEQLKNAKDLLKNSIKINEHNPLYHKMYKLDDTFQMCDRFTAVVLNEKIEGLELNEEKGDYFDCRKVINSCNPTGYEYEEVNIDMLELEQQAINFKDIKEQSYKIDDLLHINNLYFNPIYVLRAIKILGTENITVKAHCKGTREPIYLKSDYGEAVVLPILQHEK